LIFLQISTQQKIYIGTGTYPYMVKVISLSDEAYVKLKEIKRNLSFSELVINLVSEKNKRNLRDFSGILSWEEGEKFKNEITKNRKIQKIEGVKF